MYHRSFEYLYDYLLLGVVCLKWMEPTAKGKVQAGTERKMASPARGVLNSSVNTSGSEDRNSPLWHLALATTPCLLPLQSSPALGPTSGSSVSETVSPFSVPSGCTYFLSQSGSHGDLGPFCQALTFLAACPSTC